MTDGEGRVSGTVGGGGAHLTGWMPVRTFPVILLIILIHQLFKIQLVILHIRINIGNDFFGGIDHILDSIKNGTSAIVGNGIQEGNESNDRVWIAMERLRRNPRRQRRNYLRNKPPVSIGCSSTGQEENTIAFLETGAGKPSLLYFSSKHTEVIAKHTGYQVGHYCGEMGQDFWDARRWQPV
ncbi:hypothetical protein GH714_038251 [Hevea brasiliensis]|uniref:Uncharacterized protein n=1 Tax=Hevea brasiliensis TaxID=3981 RepID=A0A6A6MN67_HEVBR|nr:hypothetical protein GH714_038251 [Hevea brasiliensis]